LDETILIVDDERDLAATLEFNLQHQGYRTRIAHSGEDAMMLALREPPPSLVLLDLMLPGISGTEVCRRLRARPETREVPIIMLTARGEEIDRVQGLEVGADDYVVKPFSVRELLLRVRGLLRRSERQPTAPTTVRRHGRLALDSSAHRVKVDDVEVELTALEFRLLDTLSARAGRVLSRGQLLTDVWQASGDQTTRTVDTHVKRLRSKLGAAGAYIETVRGVGYRFVDTPES